jgi:hypothetical protein
MAQLGQTLQDMTTMKTNYISDQALDQLKIILHFGQDALNDVAHDRILRGIKAGFWDMSYRYQSVDKPFGNTLEWVMDLGGNSPAATTFSQWLSSGDGIFHICGKLGSGKSTLSQLPSFVPLCLGLQTAERQAQGLTDSSEKAVQ